MSKFLHDIVVGIDVSANFSWAAIITPNGDLYNNPFKFDHTLEGFNKLIDFIKKVENQYDQNAYIFMESTGIYHLSLFHYLCDQGFNTFIINPLITNYSKNSSIRKVKNDKSDAIKIAYLGKYNNIKYSNNSDVMIYSLQSLIREYHNLTEEKSNQVKKLNNNLKLMFPGYSSVFSNITSKTSIAILKQYQTPFDFLHAPKDEVLKLIKDASASKLGPTRSKKKYDKLYQLATDALIIGIKSPSLRIKIQSNIQLIESYQNQLDNILSEIKILLDSDSISINLKECIDLIKTIPGIGELTAISIVAEIGDISRFKKAKSLVAYFGIDPSVNESGKFKGSNNHISKRGTRIGRKALYAAALQSISTHGGKPMNEVLLRFYQNHNAKSKKLGLVAVMHKLLLYIFSILKNKNPYEMRNPELHSRMFLQNQSLNIA